MNLLKRNLAELILVYL